ncbi:MAG: Bug family tripartite tricarboxylate transporter substrate binding protein [Xanthobacteraceae bacterium]
MRGIEEAISHFGMDCGLCYDRPGFPSYTLLATGSPMFLYRITVLVIAAVIASGWTAFSAQAEFPDRPIRLIVSFPPGGLGDTVGRIFAEALSAHTGATIIVDNQGGAAGMIGAANAVRAAPDGYTILLSALSVFAIVPNMRKIDFDLGGLQAIARISEATRAFAIHPKIPAKTLAEFVDYARQNPGKLNYGSAGVGSSVHILTESFRRAAGIEMQHVPYRGAAPALQDLLAGNIDVLIDAVVVPYIEAGTLRGLAVAGESRMTELPNLPTLAEAGYPAVRTSGWQGLFGPANLPADVLGFYERNISALYSDEAFKKRLMSVSAVPAYLGPADFTRQVAEDNAYFGKLIRDADIKMAN